MVRSLGANKYRFWAGAGKTKRVRDEEQATGAGCRDPVEPIKIPIMSRRGVRKGAEGACGEEEEQEEDKERGEEEEVGEEDNIEYFTRGKKIRRLLLLFWGFDLVSCFQFCIDQVEI